MSSTGANTHLPQLEKAVLAQVVQQDSDHDFERRWLDLRKSDPVLAQFVLEQVICIGEDNVSLKNAISKFVMSVYVALDQQAEVDSLDREYAEELESTFLTDDES
ncbi:hypothetical protein KC874_03180 [Candidatus Saccharibacteria bacterium]|jgi:hypothetical protein|nr:hypothetical protein [Candidatus Saccharibacteria bacterium]